MSEGGFSFGFGLSELSAGFSTAGCAFLRVQVLPYQFYPFRFLQALIRLAEWPAVPAVLFRVWGIGQRPSSLPLPGYPSVLVRSNRSFRCCGSLCLSFFYWLFQCTVLDRNG